MSRPIAIMSIRTFALLGLALFATWYALLGGGSTLFENFPPVSTLAPPPIAAVSIDSPEDRLGWLAALAIPSVMVALVVALRRERRRRRLAALAATPIVSLDEERLWAEHLAWLEERSHAHVHALLWPGRFVRQTG